jgi:lipopolysaccharide transport protein LptA
VTFLWVRNGAEITAGNDRRITCELVEFDVAADTALFQGKVVAVQDKNVLKGERLLVDRKGGTSRLEPAEGERIYATFYQPAGAQGERPKRQAIKEALQFSSFKNDPKAPMEIEADTLDVLDAAKKAIFKGKVRAHQGEMVLRASELTAFYSGKTGLGLVTAADDAGANDKSQDKGQLVKLVAKNEVFLTSKDGETASADSAIFEVKANTALLVGNVFITKPTRDPKHQDKVHAIQAPRVKIDLTTGVYWAESDPSSPKPGPPVSDASNPQTDSSSDTTKTENRGCRPGQTCATFYPPSRDNTVDSLKKKKAPALDAN